MWFWMNILIRNVQRFKPTCTAFLIQNPNLLCLRIVAVLLFVCFGFTALQNYFTHFEPNQSSGRAKANHLHPLSWTWLSHITEQPRNKTNKMTVCPAKTQISLCIRLCCVSMGSWQHRLWSDWADAQADLSLRWAHRSFCWLWATSRENVLCKQQRHRSACAFTQSSIIITLIKSKISTLACFCSWTGQLEPYLIAKPRRQVFSWCGSFSPRGVWIWASSWENLLLPFANNKRADQPAHPCSLISIFVVRSLDSIIPVVAMY